MLLVVQHFGSEDVKRKWYLQRLEIQQTTHPLHINLKHTLQEWTTLRIITVFIIV